MSVAGLDKNDDWIFGRGLATYKISSEEVYQNVQTRLRSFKNDWFLNTDAEIDWIFLLGNLGTQEKIEAEVLRVTLTTFGVARVDNVSVARSFELALR